MELKIQERTEKLKQLKERSGCFAILTNVKEDKLDSCGLLKTYKGQYGIESDFVFLKDPMIVNDLFLKKSERIEALGMILVLALMIYRLMERQMRMYLAEKKTLLPGWAGPQTVLPASWSPQSFWRSLSARIIGEVLFAPSIERTTASIPASLGFE